MAALMLSVGCDRLKRLKIPLSGGVDSRLRHEELIRIDDDVYVRVPNPDAPPDEPYRRYRYIPADEYLANPDSYTMVTAPVQDLQQDEWRPVIPEPESPTKMEGPNQAVETRTTRPLRKKLMVVPFKDLTNRQGRGFSDLVMTRLIAKIQAASDQVVLFDSSILREAQNDQENGSESLRLPEKARWVGQSYGIHAVLMGTISHAFVSSKRGMTKGKKDSAYAIAEISARLIDTVSGDVLHQWEKRNSIFDAEAQGDFPEEKAQLKAVDIIASELSRDILEKLKTLDWYTTIANVDGNQVYINAGKQSGVQIGDTFSVYPAEVAQNPIGEIRVTSLFGLDASVGDITYGKGFKATDLVRPVFQ
jgi:TolB-like protein